MRALDGGLWYPKEWLDRQFLRFEEALEKSLGAAEKAARDGQLEGALRDGQVVFAVSKSKLGLDPEKLLQIVLGLSVEEVSFQLQGGDFMAKGIDQSPVA